MKTNLSKSAAWTISCFTLVLLLFSNPLQAQFVWDGGDGSSQDWSTGSNWVGGDPPVSDSSTQLIFQGVNNTGTSGNPLNQDIATTMDIESLEIIQHTDVSFFLGGGTLRLNPSDPTRGILREGLSGTVLHNPTVINNNIILVAPARFTIDDEGQQRHLFFNGTVDLGNNTLSTASATNRFITFNNTISGSGSITSVGTDVGLRFNTTNTFEGGLSIISSNTGVAVLVGADNALGTGRTTFLTRNTVAAGLQVSVSQATLDNEFLIGHNHASTNPDHVFGFQGVLTLNGNFILGGLLSQGKALSMVDANTVLTINGVISEENDPRGLRVTSGAGTMVITNENNTYTGQTVIGRPAGDQTPTLVVNGDISTSSSVLIHGGARLRGTGTTPGITVGSGGILAPGLQSGVGILAAEGDVLMQDGSVFEILVGDLADQSSLLAIGGGIDLEENVTLSLWGNLDGAYTIATFHTMAMPYGTFTTVLLNGSSMEWEDSGYSIFYGSDSIQVIPEPGAASLFGVATALLLLFRRRFRQGAK